MNIVVLDGTGLNPGDLSWKPFEQYGTVTVYPRTTKEEMVERAAKADIVFTNKVVIDEKAMDLLPNQSWHHRDQHTCLQHQQRGTDGVRTPA